MGVFCERYFDGTCFCAFSDGSISRFFGLFWWSFPLVLLVAVSTRRSEEVKVEIMVFAMAVRTGEHGVWVWLGRVC